MAGDNPANGDKGEGNYKASRDYNERIEKFLDAHKGEVENLAEQAAAELEGSKGDELRRAEDEGKSHAKK
jgi:hypothetical protein